jgi:hypothetical protein
MRYTVRTVCDRRTMRDFLRLPYEIYRGDPMWVPPIASEVRRILDSDRNPYFADASLELFICYADDRPAARTSVVIKRAHWGKSCDRAAFFGFFESVRDEQAVRCLFSEVERSAKSRGATSLEGPFNPNHYSELGLQINEFATSPAFFQAYNPAFYPNLLESADFRPVKIIHTRKNEQIREYVRSRYGSEGPVTASGGYTVRSFDMRDFNRELERIREVFNDAFCSNWHFLPLSREEYLFSAKFLNLVTLPELITIVEYRGEPVGVLEYVLDINPLLKTLNGRVGPIKYLNFLRARKKIRNAIIYAVGVKKAFQGTRVYKLLLDSACRVAVKYDTLETTWMSDENHLALRAAGHLGLERDKEFAIYRKELEGSA